MVNTVISSFTKGSHSDKNNKNEQKVKRHRNSDTKTGNITPQQNSRIGTVSDELLGVEGGGAKLVLRVQPHL